MEDQNAADPFSTITELITYPVDTMLESLIPELQPQPAPEFQQATEGPLDTMQESLIPELQPQPAPEFPPFALDNDGYFACKVCSNVVAYFLHFVTYHSPHQPMVQALFRETYNVIVGLQRMSDSNLVANIICASCREILGTKYIDIAGEELIKRNMSLLFVDKLIWFNGSGQSHGPDLPCMPDGLFCRGCASMVAPLDFILTLQTAKLQSERRVALRDVYNVRSMPVPVVTPVSNTTMTMHCSTCNTILGFHHGSNHYVNFEMSKLWVRLANQIIESESMLPRV